MPSTKKKPQGKPSSSRLSRKKIAHMANDRSDTYRQRAKLTIKQKPKSRSPEPTEATHLNTIGQYDSSDSNSIRLPIAKSVNLQTDFNYEIPEAAEYVINPEYEKKPSLADKIRTIFRRPKTHPQQPLMYVFLSNKPGGKSRTLRKRTSRQ